MNVGHPRVRIDDLTVSLTDSMGRPDDTVLWLRNGGGKTSLLNLIFSVLRPDRKEFLGSKSERSARTLEEYVQPSDRAVIALEWELDGSMEPSSHGGSRYVTGAFYEWRHAPVEDGNRLRRLFFAGRVSDGGQLSLSDLPLFSADGVGKKQRRTLAGFREAWLELQKREPELELRLTETQREWGEILEVAHIDPELFRYQLQMNTREGGAGALFKFGSTGEFIDFLLDLLMVSSPSEGVSTNIEKFRRELKQRRIEILPELKLDEGTIERLRPLDLVRRERETTLQLQSSTLGEVGYLEGFLQRRLDGTKTQASQHLAAAQEHELQEKEALDFAREARCTVLALELAVAENRLNEASTELARAQEDRASAEKAVHLWEAAVPYSEYMRQTRKIQDLQRQLDQKQTDSAPLLERLQEASRALADSLLWEDNRLAGRIAQVEADEAECLANAQKDRQTQTGLVEEVARLKESIRGQREFQESAEQRRKDLEKRRVLLPNETASSALRRCHDEEESIQSSVVRTQEELHRTGEQRRLTSANLARVSGELSAAESELRHKRERIGSANGERLRLEGDRNLLRVFEVPSLDVERLPVDAVVQIDNAIRTAGNLVVQRKMDIASNERAITWLEKEGLLPPSPDVERILEKLKPRISTVWSGWKAIESLIPAREGRRRGTVNASPSLAMGVVVADEDYERVKSELVASSLDLETPVALVRKSEVLKENSPRWFVVGPTSEALFDSGAGQQELEGRTRVRTQRNEQLARAQSESSELQRAGADFRAFRERYPKGWFGQEEQAVASLESQIQDLGARRSRLTEVEAQLERDITALGGKLDKLRKDLESTRNVEQRLETFSKDWESLLPQVKSDQEANEVAVLKVKGDLAKIEQNLTSLDTTRDRLSKTQSDLRFQLAEVQKEARGIERLGHYQPNPTPADLASARERHRDLYLQYEHRTSDPFITALKNEARSKATLSLKDFQEIATSNAVDENQVSEAIAALPTLETTNTKRREANSAVSGAQGTEGHWTGQHKERKYRFEKAREECGKVEGAEALAKDKLGLDIVAAEKEIKVAKKTETEQSRIAMSKGESAKLARAELAAAEKRVSTVSSQIDLLRITLRDQGISPGSPSAEAPPDGWVDPQTDEECRIRIEQLGDLLKKTREEVGKLDVRRGRACKSLRTWLGSEEFVSLTTKLGTRLNALEDRELEERVEHWINELEVRIHILQDKLRSMDEHRDTLVTEVLTIASEGLNALRMACAQSRIPQDVFRLGDAHFLKIDLGDPPETSARRDRIGALLDELITLDKIPPGAELVKLAVRKLASPVSARVLFPDPDLEREWVDVTYIGKQSGGEMLTSAVLLFSTLAQVRARNRGVAKRPTSVLILDNPIGTSSRQRFLSLQLSVAHANGIQLLYTTGVNDLDAISLFPRIVRLKNDRVDRRSGQRHVELDSSESSVSAAHLGTKVAP